MSKEFEKWWDEIGYNINSDQSLNQEYAAAKAAWEECEKRMSIKAFRCTADDDPRCFFDIGEPLNCICAVRLMKQGRGKTDCKFWIEIK